MTLLRRLLARFRTPSTPPRRQLVIRLWASGALWRAP